MNERELVSILVHGREERNLEYKGPMTWSRPEVQAKIVKSVLAMSNLRDGGWIVIGVREKGGVFERVGLSSEELALLKQDDVSTVVNKYADPFCELTVHRLKYESRDFVIIEVGGFEELPVICKKDGPENLHRGDIYARPRRKYETVRVPSQVEMREILETAVEKGVRKLRARAAQAGIGSPESREISDRQRFDDQLDGVDTRAAMNLKERLARIKKRGHWRIVVRPTVFEANRLPSLRDCLNVLERSRVTLRGWSFPHIGRCGPTTGQDWIESGADAPDMVEYWRFYQSGQFVYLSTCREDLILDGAHPTSVGHEERPPAGRYLAIMDALFRISEVFEFSARLCSRKVLSPQAYVEIKLVGMEERQLFFWETFRHLGAPYRASVREITFSDIFSEADLTTKAGMLALDAAFFVFERFGWLAPPRTVLAEEQRRFLERRG